LSTNPDSNPCIKLSVKIQKWIYMKYDIPRTPSYLDSALNFHWYGFVLTGVTLGALRWNTAATIELESWVAAVTDADALSVLGVGSDASAADMDADGLGEDIAFDALAGTRNAARDDDHAAATLEATASALMDEAEELAAPYRPGMDDEAMGILVIVRKPDIADALDADEAGRLPSPTSCTSSPPALWLDDAAELESVGSPADAAAIDPDAETMELCDAPLDVAALSLTAAAEAALPAGMNTSVTFWVLR
jgi:hypothetical protein